MNILKEIRKKPWMSNADELEPVEDSPGMFKWSHRMYLAAPQVQYAISDDDIEICDIEASGDSPEVYIEWVKQ
jgi:hypothetical protein